MRRLYVISAFISFALVLSACKSTQKVTEMVSHEEGKAEIASSSFSYETTSDTLSLFQFCDADSLVISFFDNARRYIAAQTDSNKVPDQRAKGVIKIYGLHSGSLATAGSGRSYGASDSLQSRSHHNSLSEEKDKSSESNTSDWIVYLYFLAGASIAFLLYKLLK